MQIIRKWNDSNRIRSVQKLIFLPLVDFVCTDYYNNVYTFYGSDYL